MKKLNQILDYVFVVCSILPWVISLTLALTIYYGDPIVFDFYLASTIISALAVIGYALNPYHYVVDLYDGYIPEPDRSKEHEQIQRNLYDKGYDMSKDIEYDDFEPSGFDYCDHCHYGYDDELGFKL